MRRLAAFLLTSVASLGASPAMARNGAWYVGGDFGAMIVEDTSFDFQSTVNPATFGGLTLDAETGFDGSAFIGYDLGAFRLEAEVGYKHAKLKGFTNTLPIPSTSSPHPIGSRQAFGSASALSFLVNGLLDFGDDDGLSGFLGGGVGVARVDYSNVRAFTNTGAFIDDAESRFAWQLVAGARQAISDQVDVTIRYRFFNADNIAVRGISGLPIDDGRFRSHSLLGGITFNFGAPPPPPVPPPPPPPAVEPPPAPPAAVALPGPVILFFDWDRDSLTAQAKGQLDQAVENYRQFGQARIVLAGHADRSGTADYNVGLSQRRANKARDYLVAHGVPDAVLSTSAFGESQPLVETADGIREPQNRRVEITFGPGSGW